MKKSPKMLRIEQEFNEDIRTLLIRYYYEKGYTLHQLGKKFNVNHSTVSLWMLKMGLPRRRWSLPNDGDWDHILNKGGGG